MVHARATASQSAVSSAAVTPYRGPAACSGSELSSIAVEPSTIPTLAVGVPAAAPAP